MPAIESYAYTKTAIFLHWLIAFALLFMLALGWSFDYLPSGVTKSSLVQLHKSIGITILLLSLVRLGWRWSHRVPPFPATVALWERRAASFVHALLYVAMIGVPLSGWAMVSAGPHDIVLFGLVPWPRLPMLASLENKQEIGRMLFGLHGLLAALLAVLIAGHVAAALKHHFVVRDGVLLRMAPRSCARFLNRLR